MAASIEAELQAGIVYARSSPMPAPEEALTDVYVHFDYLGNPLQPADNGGRQEGGSHA